LADYSLTGSANWSAIKAAVEAVAAPRRIVPTGAWTLTLNEQPAFACEFDAAGTAATMAAIAGSYNLTGWTIRAGNAAAPGMTIASGVSVTGAVFYGGTAIAGSFGASITSGGSGTGCTFTGGSSQYAYGANLVTGGALFDCSVTGGSGQFAYGLNVAGGVAIRPTAQGGIHAAAYGLYNQGAVHDLRTLDSITTPVANVAMCTAKAANLAGIVTRNGAASTIIIFGNTNKVTGAAGSLLYCPTPADVRLGASILDELGTANVFAGDPALSGVLSTGQAVVTVGGATYAAALDVAGAQPFGLGVPGVH
jgi:hypothetical protein